MSDLPPRSSTRRQSATVGEVIEYVTEYAKQETVGPLKGAGRWIGVGAGAAAVLGLGLSLILLGLLRLIQTELTGLSGSNAWSWVPYAIVLAVALAMLAITLLRIKKTYLSKPDIR